MTDSNNTPTTNIEPTPKEMSPVLKSAMLLASAFNLIADAPYSVKKHSEIESVLEFLRVLHDSAMTGVEKENADLLAAEEAEKVASEKDVSEKNGE